MPDIKSLFWTKNIENEIKESVDNYFNSCLSDSLISNYTKINNEYLEAVKAYKAGHNKIRYSLLAFLGLPLSFITIIPFYWTFKKFKNLRTNKINLESVVTEKGEKKLLFNRSFVSTIDFDKLENDGLEKISYKEMGPITKNLIDEIESLSMFEYETERTVPYNTSWGIFDNNKIIINASKQSWVTSYKEYSGSIQVPYTYTDSDGRNKTGYKTITAYYTHPVEEIINENISYAFMESCSSLEFKYIKQLGLFSKKSDKSKSDFENPKFNKMVDWSYNNEAQMRMIFTALGQENYVNEIEHIKSKEIPLRYHFCKEKSFFYNKDGIDDSELLDNRLKAIIHNFTNNYNDNIDNFKKGVSIAIEESIYSKFESLIYLWMVPIFQSEDHSLIIKNIWINLPKKQIYQIV